MSASDEFNSAKRKLDHGRRHALCLEAEIKKLGDNAKPVRLIEALRPSHGGLYERWLRMYAADCEREGREPQTPPDRPAYVHIVRIPINLDGLDLIAGDAIQNIRQALDHAACACARSIGKSDKGTYFPLVADPTQLEDRIREQARKLPESIKDIIRRSEPGGGALYQFHDLGIGDKHRLSCSFNGHLTAQPQHLRSSEKGWIASGFGDDDHGYASNELRVALTGSPDELDYSFRFMLHIRFNTSGLLANKLPFVVLYEVANRVAGIIEEMEAEMVRLTSK